MFYFFKCFLWWVTNLPINFKLVILKNSWGLHINRTWNFIFVSIGMHYIFWLSMTIISIYNWFIVWLDSMFKRLIWNRYPFNWNHWLRNILKWMFLRCVSLRFNIILITCLCIYWTTFSLFSKLSIIYWRIIKTIIFQIVFRIIWIRIEIFFKLMI